MDVLSNQAPQHDLGLECHGIQIQDPGLKDLFAAESEQLQGQGGGALARVADLDDILPVRFAQAGADQQQIGVAIDHGQQVIEIVRDAAGEPAQALQSLGLLQPRLQSHLALHPLPDLRGLAGDAPPQHDHPGQHD